MEKTGWFVYLLRCADGSLYAGITTDPARRLDEHNRGRAGAKYTRARRPVVLVWQQEAADRRAASRCEYLLRQLSKGQKEALVAGGHRLALPARLAEPDQTVTTSPAQGASRGSAKACTPAASPTSVKPR